jgi:hypothetical protein
MATVDAGAGKQEQPNPQRLWLARCLCLCGLPPVPGASVQIHCLPDHSLEPHAMEIGD